MDCSSPESVLRALLASTTSKQFRTILDNIGDHSGLSIGESFGPFEWQWLPFGKNLSNISSVGLATKPGRSLTERLTNAMDAILEERYQPSISPPRSALLAAQKWFGRPVSGPNEGLFNWHWEAEQLDRRINVVLLPSGQENSPTVDVFDKGVGISPSDFADTILSLQSGNKITKRYLIGAFGQGGASTLAFSMYALIVSRAKDDIERVGFTVIRVLRLDESYKEDTYAYLGFKNDSGQIVVPSCEIGTGPLAVYHPIEKIAFPELTHGTLVRHIAYDLPGLEKKLGPSPGNLYHYLHCSAFDPVFPFRLIDARESNVRDELVTGSRNRLMRLVQSSDDSTEEESGSTMRHHRPMEFIVPHGSNDASIGVEYWVVLNYRKGRGNKKDQLVLRSQSNELFVETRHPFIGTLNGQNQGDRTATLLHDVGLGMVSRHIVVHIDASRADSTIRRQLFSTNREGFKDGPVLISILEILRKMLEEDAELHEIERELTEKLAKQEAQATSEQVRREVTRLLREAGLEVQVEGPTDTSGEGEVQPTRRNRKRRPIHPEPLPTLPYPEVTHFEIVSPLPILSVALNDSEIVLAETDADSEFDKRGLIMIRSDPDALELASRSHLRGGRIRWRLRPRASAQVGTRGNVIATLTRPDGTQLIDKIDYEILPLREEKAKKSSGFIPPFDIIPIDPEDHPEQWSMTWPDLPEDPTDPINSTVAYRPVRVGQGITVYYSTIFSPFSEQVSRLKKSSTALMEFFQANYEVWIGYHAILQENDRRSFGEAIDTEEMERMFDADRIRVARMQVKQALRIAELTRQTMQSGDPE